MPTQTVMLHRWQIAVAFVAVTAAFVVQGVLLTQTIQRNQQLIHEQQASRVESCRHTYEGVREIFGPLLPPLRKQTPKMRRDLAKFNQTIDRLKARCYIQTKPKGTP